MSVNLQNSIALERLLAEAARRGAAQALADYRCYSKTQAAELMGISYATLQRLVNKGKIKPVDGRITGKQISDYLSPASQLLSPR